MHCLNMNVNVIKVQMLFIENLCLSVSFWTSLAKLPWSWLMWLWNEIYNYSRPLLVILFTSMSSTAAQRLLLFVARLLHYADTLIAMTQMWHDSYLYGHSAIINCGPSTISCKQSLSAWRTCRPCLSDVLIGQSISSRFCRIICQTPMVRSDC